MALRKVLASATVLAVVGLGMFTQVTAASAGTTSKAAASVSSAASNFRSCLDVRGGVWAAGNPVQIWRCGAAGGANQDFRLARFHGAPVLEAVAPAGKPRGPWCVTASRKGAALTIQRCTGKGGQVVTFTEPTSGGPAVIPAVVIPAKVALFTKVALAMDLTGGRTVNGTKVQGWPLNDSVNQEWALP